MAKKMTATEFKKALTDAGIDFETWGWEGVLNLISICERYNAKDYASRDLNAIAKSAQEHADNIYHYLKGRGYYED